MGGGSRVENHVKEEILTRLAYLIHSSELSMRREHFSPAPMLMQTFTLLKPTCAWARIFVSFPNMESSPVKKKHHKMCILGGDCALEKSKYW